jgi:anti-anti-sigma factor
MLPPVGDPLEVHLEGRDRLLLVRVEGEVDISNVADLRDRLTAGLEERHVGLVLDLSDTDYLDSSGLRLLMDLREHLRRRGQSLAVVAPSGGPVRRLIELIELEGPLSVHETTEAAATAAGGG